MTTGAVVAKHLGRVRYSDALAIQLRHVRDVQQSLGNHFLLTVEHDPVYTTGIRTKEYSLQNEMEIKAKTGADFVRTDRGGLITFHGHGQLVLYPILNLLAFAPIASQRKAILGIKWYVEKLEDMIINLCVEMGIPEASRSPHTGVWIGDNKICAMGIRNKGFITYHGLALNCDVDLKWFSEIVPCGIKDKGVTSLSQELGRNVTIEQVRPLLLKLFAKHFHCKVSEHII